MVNDNREAFFDAVWSYFSVIPLPKEVRQRFLCAATDSEALEALKEDAHNENYYWKFVKPIIEELRFVFLFVHVKVQAF